MYNARHIWAMTALAAAVVAAVIVTGWFSGYIHVVREYHFTIRHGHKTPTYCILMNDFQYHRAIAITKVNDPQLGCFVESEPYTGPPEQNKRIKQKPDDSHVWFYWGRHFRT